MNQPWRSLDGVQNAVALQAQYPKVFAAFAELDALGHRLLTRIGRTRTGSSVDDLVCVAILRRAVTNFIGVRVQMEASAIEPAKLGVRAQFELLLAVRFILYGARREVSLHTKSPPLVREARSRAFYVAAERRRIYARLAFLDRRLGMRKVSRADRKAMREEIEAEIARLRKHFPNQFKAFGDFNTAKQGKRRSYYDHKEWFSLFFPRRRVQSVAALAERLGMQQDYRILYSSLSGLTHPRGISHDVTVNGQSLEVHHPYRADAFPLLAHFSLGWQLLVLSYLINVHHPSSLSDGRMVSKVVLDALAVLPAPVPESFI